MTSADGRLVAGMARQAQLRERRLAEGARRVGWKAGFGTRAAMAKFGTSEPLAGFLTDTTQVNDGGSYSIDGFADPRLETEIAVRLRAPICPGATTVEILAAVGAVAPAIEIVDMGPAEDLEEVLACNIFHRAFLIGPFTDALPGTFAEARASLQVNGAGLHTDIDPAEQLGRLEDILGGMASQLSLAGDGLEAGDVVITGWVVTPLQLTGVTAARVSLADGSAVSVIIERTA
jgi:2-keto-4-pentenoate hydratase